jgi:hypothetical protein
MGKIKIYNMVLIRANSWTVCDRPMREIVWQRAAALDKKLGLITLVKAKSKR